MSFLGLVSREELQRLAADMDVVSRVHAAAEDLDRYLEQPRWYQGLGDGAPSCIAYFSPEFGITEVLPQYSGGLGILAGDHLKAASDLGVPLIGVGLLYQAGYFKQSLSRDAWQQETYPVLDPDGLPLTLLRESSPDGNGGPSRSPCPSPTGAGCWRTSGGPTSGVFRSCCWTPTFPATTTPPAASRTACTAAAVTTASSRNCCWAWAGSRPCGRSRSSPAAPRPRCSTPTKATPASSASSGSRK